MLKELVGDWKVIGCQLHARWLPDSIFREFRYSFTADDKFKLDWSDLSYPQFTGGFPKSDTGGISINMNTKPFQINFHPDDGPFAGKTLEGIFEIDHDILKVIAAFPGHPRPTEFSAKKGEVYEIWQRIK